VSDSAKEKRVARLRRHKRVRRQISGTAECPRLAVFRSLNHIYAQIIDDSSGTTLVSASSLKLSLPAESGQEDAEGKNKKKPASVKIRRSRAVGEAVAKKAQEMGLKKVTFDRGGYLYHGRVAALAEAARKSGLEF
jgi:large subunit ribosomal protein L18